MAEFVRVMQDLNRMCAAYENCVGCPLENTDFHCHNKVEMDFAVMERVIGEWVKQHPEPKYPTWYGFIKNLLRLECPDMVQPTPTDTDILEFIHNTRITADIAEKLGIEPEEC